MSVARNRDGRIEEITMYQTLKVMIEEVVSEAPKCTRHAVGPDTSWQRAHEDMLWRSDRSLKEPALVIPGAWLASAARE